MTFSKYYLSPICTKRLGDALISISNMYHTISTSEVPVKIYYHHWPKYFEMLWPHLVHPEIDVEYLRLDVPSQISIDDTLEDTWIDIIREKCSRDDFIWHPSQGYSKTICRVHPYIAQELLNIGIPEKNILVNCTELLPGAKYVQFKYKFERKDLITFQGVSVDRDYGSRFNVDISSELELFEAAEKVDVSGTNLPIEKTIELIGSAKMHVGIDSAPAHIALALNTPLVLLWQTVGDERSINTIYNVYANYRDDILVKRIGDTRGLARISKRQSNEKMTLERI